jgi:three-Cys-motif partner protein
MSAPVHTFGGDWTTEKLAIIAKYLSAYTTALKDKPSPEKPFVKGYIDAFAGTGSRTPSDASLASSSLFDEADAADPEALLKGSARLALETSPRFDRYIFIESNDERCAQLEALKTDFPALPQDISVLPGDAKYHHSDVVSAQLEVSPRGALPRPIRNTGRVADDRSDRCNESDRPVGPVATRHGDQSNGDEIRRHP